MIEYGNQHGIKYNPEKTEFCFFNNKCKRTKSTAGSDLSTEEFMLDGQKMKQVSCFRYLGVHLMDDLSNEQHIIKRRTAAYTALNKAKNLGFASPDRH